MQEKYLRCDLTRRGYLLTTRLKNVSTRSLTQLAFCTRRVPQLTCDTRIESEGWPIVLLARYGIRHSCGSDQRMGTLKLSDCQKAGVLTHSPSAHRGRGQKLACCMFRACGGTSVRRKIQLGLHNSQPDLTVLPGCGAGTVTTIAK